MRTLLILVLLVGGGAFFYMKYFKGGGFGGGATFEKKDEGASVGVRVEVLKEGTGAVVEKGKSISVHYTGSLESNGSVFDTSLKRGKPFMFIYGVGQVIRGWDLGLEGMKVGEKRKLTIPSDLAYGKRGAGNLIPPDSTLVFEVELLEVR